MAAAAFGRALRRHHHPAVRRHALLSTATTQPPDAKSRERWLRLVPSCVLMNCAGSVFATGPILTPELTRLFGAVAPASGDWALASLLPMQSAFAVGSAGVLFALGGAMDRAGPKKSCLGAAAAGAAGTAVYCAGLEAHSLPLLYASYAALSGSAFGLVYGSVVPTVQKWFPDRKGVASSVCAAAFGTGAFVWAPIYTTLLEAFRSAPAAAYDAATKTVDGVRYAEVAPGDWREAVLATAADLAAAGQPALEPGLFLVGSGNTGVVEAVFWGGALHAACTAVAGLGVRAPERPVRAAPPAAAAPAGRGVASPEGLGLAAGIFFAGFTALPLMLNSKMMLTDIFSPFAEADLFAGAAVASYIGTMSLANSAGRLTIGPLSDAVSLRAAYALCGLQIPLVLALPSIAAAAPADPAAAAAAWKAATCAIPAFYGGYVVLLAPAVATAFGTDRVGAVFPKIFAVLNLSNLASAAVVGSLRDGAATRAAAELAGHVDDGAFLGAFGAPKAELPALLAAKTATIPQLVALLPDRAAVPDPSPFLYHDALHAFAVTSTLAFACHAGALAYASKRPPGS